MTRVLALACVCVLLGGCSAWRTYQCVRDMVQRNEPYLSPQDRDDSEALAWQACRERPTAAATAVPAAR